MMKKIGIGFGVLLVALFVFGQAMTFLTRRNVPAVQEAAVRYLVEPGGADPSFSSPDNQVIFLRVGKGDPSPDLLGKLANLRVPVVAASEAQRDPSGFGPGNYVHKTTGKRGRLIYLGKFRSTNTSSATIDYNSGRLELQKDLNSWRVTNTYMGMAG